MKNSINFYEKNSIEILFANSHHTFPLHSHECFCIGIIEEGEVTFTINGVQKKLYPGMAYIIPSNVGVVITAEKQYRYITICLKNEWKEVFNNFKFKDYFLTFSSSEEIHNLCIDFVKGSSPKQFTETVIYLLKPLIMDIKEPFGENEISEIVKNACHYIRNHVHEKFSLNSLADEIHVSKYYLVKIFKKEMGVTPNQYYIQAKMFQVKKEAMYYQKGIDLAMDLNFNDQSHLCNLFKKQMGISLQDYKKSFQRLS